MLRRSLGYFVIAACFAVQPALAASVGRCGGDGGTRTHTLTCPSGQYVVGAYARGGAAVDRFGIKCAPFDAAGKRGTIGGTKIGGGSGGTKSNDVTCPKDAGATALSFGSVGGVVTEATSVWCDTKAQNVPGNDSGAYLVLGIGTPSPNCRLECPKREWLYQVRIKSGAVIDSITGYCKPVP